MRRWLAPLAVGLLVAVGAVAVGSMLARPAMTAAERADALARELRCPDCQALSVADSPTQSAAEIRRQIDALLAAGASSDEVRAHFVARYGEWILLAPTQPLWWALPLVAVLVGAVVMLASMARAGRARLDAARPGAARPAEPMRRRLHDEADALDA